MFFFSSGDALKFARRVSVKRVTGRVVIFREFFCSVSYCASMSHAHKYMCTVKMLLRRVRVLSNPLASDNDVSTACGDEAMFPQVDVCAVEREAVRIRCKERAQRDALHRPREIVPLL